MSALVPAHRAAVFDAAFLAHYLPPDPRRPPPVDTSGPQPDAAVCPVWTLDHQPTVLVVDDDAAIRDLISTALADEGYHVRAAANGQVALDALRVAVADLVLLDMQMPVMDGPTFCAKLTEELHREDIPIVVMTAADQTGVFRRRCRAKAALGKPFDLRELYTVVEHELAAA